MHIETENPSDIPASFTRFVLPFAYELTGNSQENTLLKWTEISSTKEIFWRKQYFTSEVSKVLFEKAKWYQLKNNSEIGKDFQLSFQIKNEANEAKVIQINLDSPQLVLFQKESKSEFLNTGFLIVEIYFDEKPEPKITLDDLLLINENLRYKEQIFDGHGEKICSLFVNPKEVEKLCHQDEPDKIKHFFNFWHYLLRQPIEHRVTDKQIKYKDFLKKVENSDSPKERPDWDIYADARTFVWTCAVMKNGATDLSENFGGELAEKEKWQAHNYGHWIKLLNVDKPGDTPQDTHENTSEFEREWAKDRTYHRWEESESFYGFSYHSGAAIISDCPEPPLWKHWRTMYFDMVLLLFYVRVTLFRFSDELTKISMKAAEHGNRDWNIEKWSREFNALRWEFTLFTNLYQYPLISNQQQGLEMYELARKSLDLNELFKEIQEEIHNGQEFIEQNRLKKQGDSLYSLTLVASVGLSLSIILALISTKFGQTLFDRTKQLLVEWSFIANSEYGISYEWGTLVFLTLFCTILLLLSQEPLKLILWVWNRLFIDPIKWFWDFIKNYWKKK